MNITRDYPFCEPDVAVCESSKIDLRTTIVAPKVYKSVFHWRWSAVRKKARKRRTCHSYHIARSVK